MSTKFGMRSAGPGKASETMMNEETAPTATPMAMMTAEWSFRLQSQAPTAIPKAANGNMIPVLEAQRAWSIE